MVAAQLDNEWRNVQWPQEAPASPRAVIDRNNKTMCKAVVNLRWLPALFTKLRNFDWLRYFTLNVIHDISTSQN